jgi:hypothetical protein
LGASEKNDLHVSRKKELKNKMFLEKKSKIG